MSATLIRMIALFQSPGLRISLVGAIIFCLGLLFLIVLPAAIGLTAVVLGGFIVWGGFIRTLFMYYGDSSSTEPKG